MTRSDNPILSMGALIARVARLSDYLSRRSIVFVSSLHVTIERIIPLWIGLFLGVASIRIATALTPITSALDFAEIFIPYALIALAPVAAYRVTQAAFLSNQLTAQPMFRFALYGRWKRLDPLTARSHSAFGPFGFMASLLIGMLLNIPVRSFEFLLAVPAMNGHAPEWGTTIFAVMAFDVIAMNFMYVVCFVMALRSNPYFPRMLGVAWLLDITLQLGIARSVAAAPQLPGQVAEALELLLHGNVTKVLISAAVWLPYLLLSARVNVTYRSRERSLPTR